MSNSKTYKMFFKLISVVEHKSGSAFLNVINKGQKRSIFVPKDRASQIDNLVAGSDNEYASLVTYQENTFKNAKNKNITRKQLQAKFIGSLDDFRDAVFSTGLKNTTSN